MLAGGDAYNAHFTRFMPVMTYLDGGGPEKAVNEQRSRLDREWCCVVSRGLLGLRRTTCNPPTDYYLDSN